jgi:trehalose 6-phosphate phosphatase
VLDVDGTILDIAPTPLQVHVPASLRKALAGLSKRLGGALALVSGRPLSELDRIFFPLQLPAVGGHGAELRPTAPGSTIERHNAVFDPALKRRLHEIAAGHPGVIVEDKGYSVALHYRQAPEHGESLTHEVQRACEPMAGTIDLLAGKAVVEVKQAGFDKGTAVRELMSHPPFRGRRPVFIGDDKTDEHAFAAVQEFDGRAISVGCRIPGIQDHFDGPDDVRRWLERLSEDAVASP